MLTVAYNARHIERGHSYRATRSTPGPNGRSSSRSPENSSLTPPHASDPRNTFTSPVPPTIYLTINFSTISIFPSLTHYPFLQPPSGFPHLHGRTDRQHCGRLRWFSVFRSRIRIIPVVDGYTEIREIKILYRKRLSCLTIFPKNISTI